MINCGHNLWITNDVNSKLEEHFEIHLLKCMTEWMSLIYKALYNNFVYRDPQPPHLNLQKTMFFLYVTIRISWECWCIIPLHQSQSSTLLDRPRNQWNRSTHHSSQPPPEHAQQDTDVETFIKKIEYIYIYNTSHALYSKTIKKHFFLILTLLRGMAQAYNTFHVQ